LKAFDLDGEKWHVNVQPYSGSPANFAVYTALLKPHDRLMGLDLPSGGHLTHGKKFRINFKVFILETRRLVHLPFILNLYLIKLMKKVNLLEKKLIKIGFVDYDEMEKLAKLFRPKLLIVF
jgi:glycine hydroxymethyltransferase